MKFKLIILSCFVLCSCVSKDQKKEEIQLVREYFDYSAYYEACENRIKNALPVSQSANPFDSDIADISDIPLPRPIREVIHIADEDMLVLENQISKIISENKCISESETPFCGYLDSTFFYRRNNEDEILISLFDCNSWVCLTPLSSEKSDKNLVYCVQNQLLYFTLLKYVKKPYTGVL